MTSYNRVFFKIKSESISCLTSWKLLSCIVYFLTSCITSTGCIGMVRQRILDMLLDGLNYTICKNVYLAVILCAARGTIQQHSTITHFIILSLRKFSSVDCCARCCGDLMNLSCIRRQRVVTIREEEPVAETRNNLIIRDRFNNIGSSDQNSHLVVSEQCRIWKLQFKIHQWIFGYEGGLIDRSLINKRIALYRFFVSPHYTQAHKLKIGCII